MLSPETPVPAASSALSQPEPDLVPTASNTLSQPESDLITDLARLFVGTVDLKEAQRMLRRAMRDEALRRAAGSRRRAAKLLGVDRRYVQRMLAST